MENLNIGVPGGMGTYATIHLFKQYNVKFLIMINMCY